MNQHQTHTLRSIFRELPNFSPTDIRWKNSWRQFKRAYLAISKPARSSYVESLRKEADEVKATYVAESAKS